MVDGFEKQSTIDCSTLEDDIDAWITGDTASAPAPVYNKKRVQTPTPRRMRQTGQRVQ
jgi:hypothetical protein